MSSNQVHAISRWLRLPIPKPGTDTVFRRDQAVNHFIINLGFLPKELIRACMGAPNSCNLGEGISFVVAQVRNLN